MQKNSWFGKTIIFLALWLLVTACSHISLNSTDSSYKVDEFSKAIESLSANIDENEAMQTSQLLMETTTQLVAEYEMTSPALYHNMLVNMGLRKRGLCCHWAEDLHAKLRELSISTLKFDWLVARLGSHLREHNTVVIYPVNSTWQNGLIFDPWRKAGVPFWTRVKGDKYPWKVHPLNGKWESLRCK